MADGSHPQAHPELIEITPADRTAARRLFDAWKLTHPLYQAAQSHPEIIEIAARLTIFLPEQLMTPYERKPLSVSALQEGLSQLAAAPASADAFLAGVLAKAHLILRFDLVGPDGRWDPIAGEPLSTWLDRNAGQRPPPTASPWQPTCINAFSQALLSRLVPQGAARLQTIAREYAWP